MKRKESKIFLISTVEPIPELDGEISEWRTQRILRKLADEGKEVVLLIGAFDHYRKEFRDRKRVTEYRRKFGAEAVLIPSVPYYNNVSLQRILNYWLQTFWLIFYFILKSRRGDKLLVTVPAIEHLVVTYFFRGKFIVDYRDLWPAIFEGQLKGSLGIAGKPYIALLYSLLKRSFKRATAILTISDEFKDEVLKLNPDCAEKVVVLRQYRPSANGLGQSNQTKVKDWKSSNIVYAGKISPRTSIVECARHIVENPNFSGLLRVCGVGDDRSIAELKALCSKYPNLSYLGNLGQKDLRRVYSWASFGLLPYQNLPDLSRALPNKFFEYLSNDLFILHDEFRPVEKFCAENNFSIAAQLGGNDDIKLDIEHIQQAQNLLRSDYQAATRVAINWFGK